MKRSRWIAAAGALIVMLTGCGVNKGMPTLPSEPATTVSNKVETTAPTEASAMPETETDEVSTEATQETEIAAVQTEAPAEAPTERLELTEATEPEAPMPSAQSSEPASAAPTEAPKPTEPKPKQPSPAQPTETTIAIKYFRRFVIIVCPKLANEVAVNAKIPIGAIITIALMYFMIMSLAS